MSLIQIINHIIQVLKPERATGQMGLSSNKRGLNGHELYKIFDIRKFIVKKNIIK